MNIRPYHSADFQKVLVLFDLNTPQYFAESEKADLEEYLQQKREDYFVVEENGEIIGAGGINYDPDRAVISWDFIHPDWQGKGIGRTLMDFRLAHIRSQKQYEKVIVRTSQLAYGYYEKMDFNLLEVKKDYWAKGFDLYFMEQDNKKL
ncbi:GNAT family N-acetyltransferase [Marivirga arenosa]|uniref:GNAT family N-acetyltransferase n=1 Tax=Marivirga arenosa TaxID=3059076 RepID=A0AA51R757_9BACT|nr:GNAT family N-acetyltransferase [Marivirga sp. ABR2-2]WMN07327.1 GNAT family N-acetyltransferase [Marivirga sp. ABR2-2]